MKRYYFEPCEELKGVIKTFQILDLPDVSAAGIGQRFLPDGFFEIGFNLGSDHLKITSAAATNIQLDNPVGYFYGQNNVSAILAMEGRLHIMIVKIFPWAASLLFDFDLNDCVDENLPLEYVIGGEGNFLEEQLMTGEGYENKIEILQDYLLKRLIRINNDPNKLLEATTKMIFNSKGNIKIKDIAEQVHSSPRTLQRMFQQYYGITPKKYAQQIRLRNFAAQLSKNKNLSLTELALKCGYFDQAHFNHEFSSIAMVTPTEFFFKGTPLVDEFLISK